MYVSVHSLFDAISSLVALSRVIDSPYACISRGCRDREDNEELPTFHAYSPSSSPACQFHNRPSPPMTNWTRPLTSYLPRYMYLVYLWKSA